MKFKKLGSGKSGKNKETKEPTQPAEEPPAQPATRPAKISKQNANKSHYNLRDKPSGSTVSGAVSNGASTASPLPINRLSISNQPNSLDDWNATLPSLSNLPNFRETAAQDKPALFLTKLKACQRMFIWQDGVEPEDDLQWPEKELKRQQLIELVDYINQNPKGVFFEGNFADIMDFVSVNMFRGFLANPTPPHIQYDPEEDEPLLEPCWPHLQFVMEFFLRFVVSSDVDPKIARKYIDQGFITKLLALFDSEDVRERDFLKTILHRIYGKFMQHRSFIRKSINNVFYHFTYNTERHNGIAELLEILGSIINGFALPLKDEHKAFLRKGLIPLHKVKYVSMYHNQLSYCITQFCEKDYHLAEEIILGILRYWPQTNSPKEVLYLQELEEVLELTQPQEFEKVLQPLFHRINLCINSQHFQVAERGLFYWHNEYIVSYIAQHRHKILPIVFSALMSNTKGHWNTTVYQLTLNVVKMFNEMDSHLFEECANNYKKRIELENEAKTRRNEGWEKLSKISQSTGPKGWKPRLVTRESLLSMSEGDRRSRIKLIEESDKPTVAGLRTNKMFTNSRYGALAQ